MKTPARTHTPSGVPLTARERAVIESIARLGTDDPTPVAADVGRPREYVQKAILRLRSLGVIPEAAP